MKENGSVGASLLLMRLGLGVVFLFFGIGKFRNDEWALMMHSMDFFQTLPWKVEVSILISGILEVATGACLLAGFYLRLAALLAACQLSAILVLLGYQEIFEIRDIGLLAMAISIAVSPRTGWRLDSWVVHGFRKLLMRP